MLQEEPLIFKVWISNNSESNYHAHNRSVETSLGLVYVDLNPLLRTDNFDDDEQQGQHVLDSIDGFFPLYDTLNGVRGELELAVKLDFIGDGQCYSFKSIFPEQIMAHFRHY